MTFDHRNFQSPEVAAAFQAFPGAIRKELLDLRTLILEVAAERVEAGPVEETLKWGQPSYLTKYGSTVRLGWKAGSPYEYAMYFHCQTKLVDTFKEIYRRDFTFVGNRAIVFASGESIPRQALKHCVALSLNYHRLKHLELLGA